MSGLRDRHLVGGRGRRVRGALRCPVIGFLGVAGFAATAVTLAFAGLVFAVVVGLAAIAAVLVRRSRARRASCTVPQDTEPVAVELGPTRTGDIN